MTVDSKKTRPVFSMLVALALAASLSACVVVEANPDPTETSAVVGPTPTITPVDGKSAPAGPSTPAPSATAPTTEPVKEWSDTIDEARSGVAHLLVTRCDDAGAGTGFLVDDNLVVTAAHVVKDAAEIVLRIDGELVDGQVLGTNDRSDIALVRTVRAINGHQFKFIEGDPRIGTEIRALGFPQNTDVMDAEGSLNGFTANAGDVTALNQVVDYGFGNIEDMIRIDASTDSGNSGGPLVTKDGEIVGLVSGGRMTVDGAPVNGWSYAVTAPRIVAAIEEWKQRGTMVDEKFCQDAPAPDSVEIYSEVSSSHNQATNIAHSLVAHGQAINNGNYESAYAIFTGSILGRVGSEEKWAQGIETSYWHGLIVEDVEGMGDRLQVRATVVTGQDPEGHSPIGTTGQACSIWAMDYTMAWDGTRWLMEDVDSIGTPEDCTAVMEDRDNMDGSDEFGD